MAYAVLAEKDELKVTKPLQLGCFILSHARVLMSHNLSLIGADQNDPLGGYQLMHSAYYYTDTDALMIRKSAYDRSSQHLFGSELGQLEDELKGGLIIRAAMLAPKTYCFEYLNKGYIYTKVRCKGVPHSKDIRRLWPQCKGEEEAVTGNRAVYKLYNNKRELMREVKYLDCQTFHDVLFHGHTVVAEFDQFRKLFFDKAPSKIADVRIKLANRHLSKQLWWAKGKRKVIDIPTGFSVPIGHKDYPNSELAIGDAIDGSESVFDYSDTD